MFIELIDVLRCVHPHEDSWLVGSFRRMQGRDVVEGSLGCPICAARYPISGGAVYFDSEVAAATAPSADADSAPAAELTAGDAPNAAPREEDVLRIAALLALADPGGIVVLGGAWGTLSQPLAALADVLVLLLNPTAAILEAPPTSAVISPRVVPLAAGSCRGVVLGGGPADAFGSGAGEQRVEQSLVESAVTVLRRPNHHGAEGSGGRLIAPPCATVPAGVVELARDERCWVGERVAVHDPVVSLGRARR
ncbi:MAG: hypothetical protein ACRENI_01495 [Gemmatimonadaceae bacterium]